MSQTRATLSRRQFIRMTALVGAAAAVGLSLAHGQSTAQPVEHVQVTRLLLGSIAHLTVISPNAAQARAAINAAFDRMVALEAVFSRFRPDSQLSRLNATGALRDPHPELKAVLSKAITYGDLSGGAFDVTVEALLKPYRAAAQSGTLPTEDQIMRAQQLVDYRQIAIQEDSIRLNLPGMAVTLDGIAKGYIIDAGAAVLRNHGCDQVMVELGGDLQTFGSAAAQPWQVSIQAPPGSASQQVAQLVNRALATSGDYQYPFTPDRRLHHILDPHRGVSPDELSSASVIASTACDADALATALMVMGTEAGLALIARLPDAEALVISKHGSTRQSANFPVQV